MLKQPNLGNLVLNKKYKVKILDYDRDLEFKDYSKKSDYRYKTPVARVENPLYKLCPQKQNHNTKTNTPKILNEKINKSDGIKTEQKFYCPKNQNFSMNLNSFMSSRRESLNKYT